MLGVRPFQCDACGKSFASAGMLRSHKFTHAPRIFKCDCCDQSFPRRNTLLVHLRAVHMQEKPYECDLCGQRFPRSSSMTRHRSDITYFFLDQLLRPMPIGEGKGGEENSIKPTKTFIKLPRKVKSIQTFSYRDKKNMLQF